VSAASEYGQQLQTAEDLAVALSCSGEHVQLLWRMLGLPRIDDEEAFTEQDRDLLALLLSLVRAAGDEEGLAVSLARSLGHHSSRLATWQVIAIVESLTDVQGLSPEDAAQRASKLTTEHLDDLERLLVQVWRRHVAAVTDWRLDRGAQQARELPLTVGFADMVDYTRLSASLDERAITELVRAFVAVCVDVVSQHGGRIVKTMGDEVLFVADEVASGVAIGVRLAAEMAHAEGVPDVRVGLATGTVISMSGDVYGPTVNLASRLTRSAEPGTVLVDEVTAVAASGAGGLWVSPLHERTLHGVGAVRVAVAQSR
jgi:adenylate cyclase